MEAFRSIIVLTDLQFKLRKDLELGSTVVLREAIIVILKFNKPTIKNTNQGNHLS
jgi:hypothetical protein